MYILDADHSEVYDGATNTWSKWITPPINMAQDACTVVWKNFIIYLGYHRYEKFDLITQTWSVIYMTSEKYFYLPSCFVLPTDEILVAGGNLLSEYRAELYNPETNSWRQLPNSPLELGMSSIVQLGKRVFVVGGLNTTVTEFNVNTETWSIVPAKQRFVNNYYATALEVPAELFANKPGGCRGL